MISSTPAKAPGYRSSSSGKGNLLVLRASRQGRGQRRGAHVQWQHHHFRKFQIRPLGGESRQRKTYASRVTGKEARFLTLIEPHQGAAKIKSAVAASADSLRVEFVYGRVQSGFAGIAIHAKTYQ